MEIELSKEDMEKAKKLKQIMGYKTEEEAVIHSIRFAFKLENKDCKDCEVRKVLKEWQEMLETSRAMRLAERKAGV